MVKQSFGAIACEAAVERMFFNFRIVHSKLRKIDWQWKTETGQTGRGWQAILFIYLFLTIIIIILLS